MRHRICSFAILLLAACGAVAPRPTSTPPVPAAQPASSRAPDHGQRQEWLEMFARDYFPGRSGQVFLVNRAGDITTSRDPLYAFMHGSPWDCDTHIPLIFHGAPFVRRLQSREPVVQQDVAPTLGAILGAPPLATYTGRVLTPVLAPDAGRPRIAMLIVLDAMRADYFDKYADVMPTLSRMRDEGAWFSEARMNVLPTVTAVGHATIGTGTDPRIHGITANSLFNRVTGKVQEVYDQLDPKELMALTLADEWNIVTDGQAVIIGQGGAMRATAGLVGHGACLLNGRPVLAASYSSKTSGWESNAACYKMSPALGPLVGKDVWESAHGVWMGHDISNAKAFRSSSLYEQFEGEAVLAVMDAAALGEDPVTDLVLVNMKGPDYVAHAWGPDSPELKATLAELDRQMAGILALLDRKAGPGQSVVVITADHGMPAEPAPGRRHYTDEIIPLVNGRFDAGGKGIILDYSDAANSQMYIDTARLRSLGYSLADVATYLESLDYIAAAFTEDEVREAQSRLLGW